MMAPARGQEAETLNAARDGCGVSASERASSIPPPEGEANQ